MRIIEIKTHFPEAEDRPPVTDWISEWTLAGVKREASEHGLRVEVVGPVSWQRLLDDMENPPL